MGHLATASQREQEEQRSSAAIGLLSYNFVKKGDAPGRVLPQGKFAKSETPASACKPLRLEL